MPDNSTKFQKNFNIEIPKWINAKYFETILKNEITDFEKITKFTTIAATPPGENYTSILMRVEMDIAMKDGYSKQKSFIVKTMLENDKGGSFLSTLQLFPRERLMYEQIIPKLEQLYAEKQKNVKFAPTCHWVESIATSAEQNGGRITLVMEDLQVKKFKNVSRLKGFDMQHMKRVLEKLAEFHAATAVLHERCGEYVADLRQPFVNLQKQKSYEARIASYKAAMATWGWENYQKYAERIPTAEQYVNSIMHCFKTDPQDFQVLNHGDFWSNNIMVNYTNSGKDISQLRFVDYQMCRWGSPAQDLWELIICSSESNLRIRRFDEFIYMYHTHLVRCLDLLEYNKPLPKLRELHMCMLKYCGWGFFFTFTHLVLILLPPDREASILKLLATTEEGDEFRKKAYTNPLYVRAVLDIFPFLHRRGALEF